MRNLSKVLIGLTTLFFITQSYAIEINVKSTSRNIEGLGFSVNGSRHGGAGSEYHASDMPKGNYSFGLRAHGKDISCYTRNGKKMVQLTHDTNALLMFNGKRCGLKI